LSACDSVRDLGVIVNESLTPSNHIAKITTTAHQRVNTLLRSFTSRDVAILVKAFVTYVRPLLEYNTVVWSPHLNGDIHTIAVAVLEPKSWGAGRGLEGLPHLVKKY